MQPVELVAGEFRKQPVLDHGAGAAEAFFGRLENEMHGAVEIAGFGEIARGPQQHGGMAIMAAAVEAAGNGRAPFQIGVLFHRQRIHVCAQTDPLAARALALEHADHAGAAEASMPHCVSLSATIPDVRTSSKPISGCACRSLRIAVSSSAKPSMRSMLGMSAIRWQERGKVI